jgi:hypothetical protein
LKGANHFLTLSYQQFEQTSLKVQHTYPKHNLMVLLKAFAHSSLQPFPAHKLIMLDADNDFINSLILNSLSWLQIKHHYIYFNYKKNLAQINLALAKGFI